MGVDLAQVKGTGPGGRIQGEDVRRFAEEGRQGGAQPELAAAGARVGPGSSHPDQPVEPSGTQHSALSTQQLAAGSQLAQLAEAPAFPEGLPGRLVPLGRKRRITADRMALSARTVARITLNMEVDAGEMIRMRARLLSTYEARSGVRLSYNDILVKVVATALRDFPYLNSRWTDKGIYLVEPINVGAAIALEDGLVVPVVRNADRKGLGEISVELAGLLAKAREDRLTLEEITGGTFTLTNLGMFDVDSFTPIVNPPETAILGVGRIAERAVGREGQMVLRPTMTLSLSVDHRVVDGAPAARFLQRVKQLLEDPYLLV